MTRSANGEILLSHVTLGEGRPLVLLHGLSDSLESWIDAGYAAPLAAAGHQLLLLDQRGHGASSRPRDPRAYGAEARAGDVITVMDSLGVERADLLGYSLGGWAALNVARFHPERVGRLIVGGCHPFGQSMAFYRDALAGGLARWIDLIERLGGPLPPGWKARLAANDIAALRAAVAEDRPDISRELAGFAGPCLFYAGSEDPLSRHVARAARLLPSSSALELEGMNHVGAFMRSDLLLGPLLDFLEAT